jgi:hypothetical protein
MVVKDLVSVNLLVSLIRALTPYIPYKEEK